MRRLWPTTGCCAEEDKKKSGHIIYLCEHGREDLWLFSEAKMGPRAEKLGKRRSMSTGSNFLWQTATIVIVGWFASGKIISGIPNRLNYSVIYKRGRGQQNKTCRTEGWTPTL